MYQERGDYMELNLKNSTHNGSRSGAPSHLCALRLRPSTRIPEVPKVSALLRSEEGLAWRRLHESKAKLKESQRASFILAAFSMSAMTEVDVGGTVPQWLYTVFALNTMTLIAVHVFSLVISTWLLPSMEAVSKEYVAPESGDFTVRPVPSFSPHDRLKVFVTLSCNFSLILGLFLFLLEVVLLCWIKFWDTSQVACWAGTAVMSPFLLFFLLFCWHFHRSLSTHIYNVRSGQLDAFQKQLEGLDITDVYESSKNY